MKKYTVRLDSAQKTVAAIHAFADACGYREPKKGYDHPQYTEPVETIVTDLLAGLMHYCENEEIDFDRSLVLARRHYTVERIEEPS
jgi:hypothetical protein